MTENEPSDEVLMLQTAHQDDMNAFSELVSLYEKFLVNYFARMGVYGDCEDLAQETLVRVYKHRHRYRQQAKFKTYLFRVAKNAWIDHQRRKQRWQDRIPLLQHAEPDHVITGQPMARDDVQQALDSLSDRLRSVVVLHMYEQMDCAEISDVLGIPQGTVKSRMHHAIKQLKQWYAREDARGDA